MQPTLHTLKLPNLDGSGKHDICVVDWGDAHAQKTVVCVHGLTRNARDFDLLAQALAAQGYRVLAPSMAGRGESPWLDNPMLYTYPTYLADCIAMMDNFHLRMVDWIGTSMGGMIGMMLEAHTKRIRKLVLNDVGIHLSATALKRIYDYVNAMPKQFASAEEAETYLAHAFKPFGIADAALWAQFVASSLTTRDGQLRYACDPRILEPLRELSKNFTEVTDTNLSAIWAEVKTPTLILHGAESDVLTAETIQGMRVMKPRVESITFPGIGHAPALMDESQIQPIIDWLTGARGIDAGINHVAMV